MRSIDIATPKAYNDHNVFLFVCIVFIHSISNWILCGHLVSFTIYPNKSLFECDTIGKSYVDPKKIWNRIVERRACTKKTSNYTAMLRADYVQLFQLLFHLFVCFGFDLSSSFNSSFVHLCAYAYLWVEFFWSQRNNDIGHMISIAIIQLLPKRAAFILFISAPLFALFLSLSLTVHCNGFFKSMLFCQFSWRFYFLLNFSNIFCVL